MASILCHTNVSEVVSKYPPKPVSNLKLTPGRFSISLTWEDPEDYTEEGYACAWESTVVMMKTGSKPKDIHDGMMLYRTYSKNLHKDNAYTITNLTAGTTYYFSLFSCSMDGIYGEGSSGSAVPIQYKIMTVKINLNNYNPATCGSYEDDAINMTAGKHVPEWEKFFGYKPCLFKDGKVVGYLNPDDYTKFEDGSAADIISGNAGDVMVEFPRRGVKISKSGKIVTVSMTDDPNSSDFKYYAHQRGSVNKDYFYIGAYIGYVDGDKLRSLSGKSPTCNYRLSEYDTYGKANGTGYGCFGYYQFLYLQVMYVLQYEGSLNSQEIHGYGYSNNIVHITGGGNSKGMMYGVDNYGDVLKLFGIENLWGDAYQRINNYYVDTRYHIKTTTDDTIVDNYNYTDHGSYGGSSSSHGFITDCLGTTEAGFTGTYNNYNGSDNTYFCDSSYIISNSIPCVGGYSSSTGYEGIFYFYATDSRTGGYAIYIGSRLGYL